MKIALTAACSFTLLATGGLSLSLLVLHPPRANVQQWFLMAGLFVAESVLTLVALRVAVAPLWLRALVTAGGVAVAWVGATWAYATVNGAHFEGYALVLGSVLAAQGVLTIIVSGSSTKAALLPSRHCG